MKCQAPGCTNEAYWTDHGYSGPKAGDLPITICDDCARKWINKQVSGYDKTRMGDEIRGACPVACLNCGGVADHSDRTHIKSAPACLRCSDEWFNTPMTTGDFACWVKAKKDLSDAPAAIAQCDCGALKARTTHAEWCGGGG